MSSDVDLSGNRWDDLYFTPDHPDADRWHAEIVAEMAAGYPDDPLTIAPAEGEADDGRGE
ncbi:hypothetical protein AB0A95_34680 [Micromonospora sp. NPDC049230]|uniref:hypothetical protein n=1 Tax=Micromonospora sp. NPDC049230 TaxID=3155502 RepID=UPI0033C0FF36